jgi:hypothetical protein
MSVEKAIPPSTSMVFLGILVDTVSCTLSITKERLDEMSSLVEDWLIRSKCTLKELQSLLGKLHFVSTHHTKSNLTYFGIFLETF